jgi:hypothetical protein
MEQLLHEGESASLDYKRDQYPFAGAADEDKGEILKDILSFANGWRHAEAYILLGVEEVIGRRSNVVGVSHHIPDNDLQQFVNSKTNRPVTFSYRAYTFEGKQLGVITIPQQDRPFYLKKDFGRLKKEVVYYRQGTTTALATPDVIAKMGTPVEIAKLLAAGGKEDAAPKPLTPEAAGELVKKYLSDDRHRIRLNDLVRDKGNELARQTVGPEFPTHISPPPSADTFTQRARRYEEISQVALAMMIEGCYYGTQAHERLWVELLQRVANLQGERGGYPSLLDLRRYPALLLLYGGGMAAVAARHYETLHALLTKPKITDEMQGTDQPPLYRLSPYDVMTQDHARLLVGSRRLAPLSDHLFEVLRGPCQALLPANREYQLCFDRFEYLRSLLEVDETGDVRSLGCFGWRGRLPGENVREEIKTEEQAAGPDWPPYQASWFEGERQRFLAARKKVEDTVVQYGWR